MSYNKVVSSLLRVLYMVEVEVSLGHARQIESDPRGPKSFVKLLGFLAFLGKRYHKQINKHSAPQAIL